MIVRCKTDFSYSLPYYLFGHNMFEKGKIYSAEISVEETDFYIIKYCRIYYTDKEKHPFRYKSISKTDQPWGVSDNLYDFDQFFDDLQIQRKKKLKKISNRTN